MYFKTTLYQCIYLKIFIIYVCIYVRMYVCMYECMYEYVHSNTVIVEVVLVCCYLIFATVLAYTSCSIISPEVRSPSIECEMFVCINGCMYVGMYVCTVCIYSMYVCKTVCTLYL